jgi:leucyl/phenylalanyl-tRNA--protein transferase
MAVFQLTETPLFPPPELAREDGLLAVGGDLSIPRLLRAYRSGIFPWYSPGDPILWWSPNPRLVLFPDEFHISKRLARTIRQNIFEVTFDTAFKEVITNCAQVRTQSGEGTWIDESMQQAYCKLHEIGYGHSVECWQDGKLVGGLYGIAIGSIFFGESMFSLVSNSSKVAVTTLVEHLKKKKFDLIDCQIGTPHLQSLGAREITGAEFNELLAKAVNKPSRQEHWQHI